MVPFVATLAACGGGDSAGDATMEGAGPASAPPAPAAPAAAAGGPIMADLRPVTGYQATGHVHMERDGTNIVVNVDAESRLPQADYPLHIHEGRCAEGGRVVAALNSVEGQEAGEGRSMTRVEASTLSPTANYFVQLHSPQGAPIACADLPPVTL